MALRGEEGDGRLPDIATLRQWAHELGFCALGVAQTDLAQARPGLEAWLDAGFHGEMDYMVRHAAQRLEPRRLVEGVRTAVMVAMDYAPTDPHWRQAAQRSLEDGAAAYVSLYARGRDYHRVMRRRLEALAGRIASVVGRFGHRAFCDSAPVMEAELATRASLGWRGKHTLVVHPRRGSTFFLGSLLTTLDWPQGEPMGDHCGRCDRCMVACPTGAIVAPYRLDARRCISYLTIELEGPIPVPMRRLIGNRIYGCDDCQLACPWNRFARSGDPDLFGERAGLAVARLVDLFSWSSERFESTLQGSAIRRIGHERWLRNIAVALGNAGPDPIVRVALEARADDASALVREHVRWALEAHDLDASSAAQP